MTNDEMKQTLANMSSRIMVISDIQKAIAGDLEMICDDIDNRLKTIYDYMKTNEEKLFPVPFNTEKLYEIAMGMEREYADDFVHDGIYDEWIDKSDAFAIFHPYDAKSPHDAEFIIENVSVYTINHKIGYAETINLFLDDYLNFNENIHCNYHSDAINSFTDVIKEYEKGHDTKQFDYYDFITTNENSEIPVVNRKALSYILLEKNDLSYNMEICMDMNRIFSTNDRGFFSYMKAELSDAFDAREKVMMIQNNPQKVADEVYTEYTKIKDAELEEERI